MSADTVTLSAERAIQCAKALSFEALWTSPDKRWYRCCNCGRECYLVRVADEEPPKPGQCIDAGRNSQWLQF